MARESASSLPITVTVNLSCRDFVNFNLQFGLLQMRRFIVMGVCWVFVTLYTLYAYTNLPPQPGANKNLVFIPVAIVPAVVLVVLPLSTYMTARRRWHAVPEIRETREYTFTPEGFQIVGESFTGLMTWPHVVTAGLAAGLVYLGTRQKQFYLIPLSAFDNEEDLTRFRELVRTTVDQCRL